jgi:hypothetical protein
MDDAGSFRTHGFATARGLVPERVWTFLHDYALKSAATGRLKAATVGAEGTPSCYGDPMMEALLERLTPFLERATRLSLYPTYSYFRVYRQGDVLVRHIDRDACEASVTLSLGGDEVWPIWIEPKLGPTSVRLRPGDGLIYRGIETPHWRERFDGQYAVQLFLHYVDRTGPCREWIFDKRGGLATSAAARVIIDRLLAPAPRRWR